MYHRPLDVNKAIHILSNNYIQTIIIIGWLILTYNYNLIAENLFLFKPLLNLDLNYIPRKCLTLSRFHNICILEILNWLILQLIKSLQIRMIKRLSLPSMLVLLVLFLRNEPRFYALASNIPASSHPFFCGHSDKYFFQCLAYKGERYACPPNHTLIFHKDDQGFRLTPWIMYAPPRLVFLQDFARKN